MADTAELVEAICAMIKVSADRGDFPKGAPWIVQ